MTVVFTICSNNYLAQAKALGDSLLKHNPSYRFTICLVDRLSSAVDYGFFKPYEIITIEEIGIEGFDEMAERYDITELNTSVKPFIFDFLFKRSEAVEAVIYIDPDIMVYDAFTDIDDALKKSNFVLTPHFFTPILDEYRLNEQDILNAGIYNLGFIAVKRSGELQKFLNWWMSKLKTHCYIKFEYGLFVDQIWINFVPLYFEKVEILRHLGHNVAYWNLHERIVSDSNDKFRINDTFPLVFFHFSGYNTRKTDVISKYQNRFKFEDRKDILPLFQRYTNTVTLNRHDEFSKIGCYFVEVRNKILKQRVAEFRKENPFIKRAMRYGMRKLSQGKDKILTSLKQ